MKKLVAISIAAFLAASVFAQASKKTLVVYFSQPETLTAGKMTAEEDYSTVVVDGKVLGNVQYVAQLIQEEMKGDIFRIEPVTPYPMDHAKLEQVATKEKRENARPKIKAALPDISKYDTVFIGFPNWYADMPMIMYTFLDSVELSGKKVIPFVVSGGSGFSRTIETITKLEPNAAVEKNGLSVYRTRVDGVQGEVKAWLKKIGISK
ncbi:MAG: flavodoxin [Treponema sp.]|nr:flavodoxin [Treponema sp.]